MKNLFCKDTDLHNEAAVEALFVDRILVALAYPDNRVRRKESIEEIVIGRGSKKEKYKPDYVLLDSASMPIMVLDAKAPDVNISNYLYQVSSYALHLNQKFPSDKNPVLYAILTNGHVFAVYPWDSNQPVFFLRFEDFQDRNEKYLELRSNLSYSAFKQAAATKGIFDFERPSITSLIRTFNECHNLIRDKEKLGPTDAFYEFSKIMFIKIREDNNIHSIIESGKNPKLEDFVFSTHWIEREERVEANPFDAILFRQIQNTLERQIREKKKKRIFAKDEGLNLRASTTKEVVKKLQNFDLYGIDEDLNGRMFETFLNATVRGKELGQFFTPRGVVHYMVETAPLSVIAKSNVPLAERMPLVLDGCCGSGGFLIDAMAQFSRKINQIARLTDLERAAYISEVNDNHLYGIEANDKIARIARLNMYLHGDGGSKIFKADTLDKQLAIEAGMSEEEKDGLAELRKYVFKRELHFDVVLTNPPFSMKYRSGDVYQNRILSVYEIAKNKSGVQSRSEKSNVLFLERYSDLLKPDTGELLTIIDDTVLNGEDSQSYRDFILENFVIVQVVSLPFNTFFRAEANIKTSIIHLRRKRKGEQQGSVFMAITNNIGHDDHSRDTPERNNMHIVSNLFDEWKNGEKITDKIINNQHPDEPLSCPLQVFEIAADRIVPQRLDAFYYAPELRQAHSKLLSLAESGKIDIRKGSEFSLIERINQSDAEALHGRMFKYFEIGDVSIDGTILTPREDRFENLPTRARLRVQKGDIVFAKNNSSRGTTVIIPEWFSGGLVTTGFIGIRPQNEEEALILWNACESEFFRKQVYYFAITASQPEVRDNIFREEMMIPWPKTKAQKDSIIANARSAEEARAQLRHALSRATETIESLLE